MTERYFEQLTNPNYREQFRDRMAALYLAGKHLAKESPDNVFPMADDQPGGPQAFGLEFNLESMTQADFPDEYCAAELVFWDEIKGNDDRWGDSISVSVKRVHSVDVTAMVVTHNYRIFSPGDPQLPPVNTHTFTDVNNKEIEAPVNYAETVLSASGHGIDLQGADMLLRMIESESQLRHGNS